MRGSVSEADQNLVARTWLVGRRGSRVVVRSGAEKAQIQPKEDVDGLINTTIRAAGEQGYSLGKRSGTLFPLEKGRGMAMVQRSRPPVRK